LNTIGQEYWEKLRSVWDLMAWQCTNCKKDLEIAKKGSMNYLKTAGMVILECNHCGFEFMTKAMTEDDQIDTVTKSLLTSTFDVDAFKKRVKSFQLK
jgi:ribosomal protein L37AE/L43A